METSPESLAGWSGPTQIAQDARALHREPPLTRDPSVDFDVLLSGVGAGPGLDVVTGMGNKLVWADLRYCKGGLRPGVVFPEGFRRFGGNSTAFPGMRPGDEIELTG